MSQITLSPDRHVPSAPGKERGAELDVAALGRIVLRRKRIVLALTFAGIALAVIAILLSTPRYQASAQLQVMTEESGLSAARLSGGRVSESSDPLDFNLTLQTYVNVLTSDTLALRVMDELRLDNTKEYRYKSGPKLWTRAAATRPDASGTLPDKRVWLLKRFHKNLAVGVIPGTRIIKVDFSGPDPELAARVLNQLLQDFVAYNFQVRYETTVGPSDILGKELDRLRQQVNAAENHAAMLQHQAGSFGVTDNYNVVLSRLEALNKTALEAESNRVLKEAVYQVTRTGDPELISTLAGSGLGGTSIQGGGLSLIQQLRQQQAQVKAEYAQDSVRYGENYPKVVELNQRLASLDASIAQEVKKLASRAKNDYLIAKQQEDETKQAMDSQKALANEANDSTVQYLMAKAEADSDRQIYLNLSEKLRQVQLVAGLHSSNINVIDPARTPASPSSPKIPLFLGIGLLGGLVCGLATGFITESKDPRLRNIEEAEAISGLPLLGIIPEIPKQRTRLLSSSARDPGLPSSQPFEMLTSSAGTSSVVESYRAVRTSLLLHHADNGSASVCMITSAMRGDGKSTTTVNIATVFAKLGVRTLIIDGDLRSGTLAQKLGIAEAEGLSEALVSGHVKPSIIQQVPNTDYLHAIPAGIRPPNPSELLTSNSLSRLLEDLRSRYEFIFIDTPPCIPVTDAVAMAKSVDSFIFVVRPGFTTRQALAQSVRRLGQAGTPCAGILVNAVNPTSAEYINYGGYGLPTSNTPAYEVA